jgi:hypothetical protein
MTAKSTPSETPAELNVEPGTEGKAKAPEAVVSPHVPPLRSIDTDPKPGAGQVLVVSPTGFRSVVDEEAFASLEPQGYTRG